MDTWTHSCSSLYRHVDAQRSSLYRQVAARRSSLDRQVAARRSSLDRHVDTRCSSLDRHVDTERSSLYRHVDTQQEASRYFLFQSTYLAYAISLNINFVIFLKNTAWSANFKKRIIVNHQYFQDKDIVYLLLGKEERAIQLFLILLNLSISQYCHFISYKCQRLKTTLLWLLLEPFNRIFTKYG